MSGAAPREATLEILDRLVGFATISAESNLELIGYAEDLLGAAGFATRRLPDPSGRKAGLVARRGGAGPGGILLSAHSDVVPVEGQNWTLPPFRLSRDGERLFGRGTTDMKGFLASMLSMAVRAGDAPGGQPIMLSISYDEEIGCVGIRQMLPELRALGWRPGLCIVGEPTGMRPATGHKGKAALRATFRGRAGHSAMAPRYVNALHLAGEFLGVLRRLQAGYAAGDRRDPDYAVPYSTVHAGRMRGGTALNIVPDHAVIDFELRYLPGDRLEDFLRRLEHEAGRIMAAAGGSRGDASIDIEIVNRYPGLEIDPGHDALRRVASLGSSGDAIKVPYGTEAGYFAQLGFPTVVCGPGDMEGQGHKPDEFLAVSQLGQCDRMMDRILGYPG